MLRVLILKGLPASGKSTYARQLIDSEPGRWKRINKDDLRAMLDNGRWSKVNEQLVLKFRDLMIVESLEKGFHVIVDDTNLHTKHEDNIRLMVKGTAEVEVKFFDTPIEECIERDRKRANGVGEKVIRDMHRQFLAEQPPKYVHQDGLPFAVICDIDGTLADISGRGPYDTTKYHEDKLNQTIKNIFDAISENIPIKVIVSGRDEEFREVTENWLRANGVKYNYLFMRSAGDVRKDFVVKREIFENAIRPSFNVYCVLDDRNQVVEMWRSLGLTVLQVADGNF